MPRFVRQAARQRYSAPTPPNWWQSGMGFGHTTAGVAINAHNAITLPAFMACVRVIAEDIASLPIQVFKKRKSGGTQLVEDHDISWRFRRSPDGDAREMSSLQWREAWYTHCLTRGNGYAEVEWTKDGQELLGLHLSDPDRTHEDRDTQTGKLWYRLDGQTERVRAVNMLHLAMPGFNGITGWSPVALLREAIGLGKAAELFGASFFGNGAVPKGMLKYPGKLSPEAKTNLRASWDQIHGGSGQANKTAILEQGLDWVNTQVTPDEGQFTATRQFQVLEVARIFRVPPHKIGDYSQSHLSNIEASNLDYLMTVLRPWCLRVEQCLDLKLLTDKEARLGYYVRHDLRALLRASIKDRALYYQTMFELGMSADEIRELEDLNPIGEPDGGTARFRSVNTFPLNAPAGRGITTPTPLDTGVVVQPADDPSGDVAQGSYADRIPIRRQVGPDPFTPKNGRFSHENGVI